MDVTPAGVGDNVPRDADTSGDGIWIVRRHLIVAAGGLSQHLLHRQDRRAQPGRLDREPVFLAGAGYFFGAILFLMLGFNHLAEYVSSASVLLAGLLVRAAPSTPRERCPLDH